MNFLAQDILDEAEKAAHLSDKGLFFVVIILMGGVIAYLFRDAKKTAERVATEHAQSMESLVNSMEKRSSMLDQERLDRINTLLQVIRENTGSSVKMAEAIAANTHAIHDFESTLNRISEVLTLVKKT